MTALLGGVGVNNPSLGDNSSSALTGRRILYSWVFQASVNMLGTLGTRVPVVEAAVELGVDGVGFGELVFKDDDAACRIKCGTALNQFTDSCRDPQLITRVAAVSALGALRGQ